MSDPTAHGWHPPTDGDVELLRYDLDSCRAEIERLRSALREKDTMTKKKLHKSEPVAVYAAAANLAGLLLAHVLKASAAETAEIMVAFNAIAAGLTRSKVTPA